MKETNEKRGGKYSFESESRQNTEIILILKDLKDSRGGNHFREFLSVV